MFYHTSLFSQLYFIHQVNTSAPKRGWGCSSRGASTAVRSAKKKKKNKGGGRGVGQQKVPILWREFEKSEKKRFVRVLSLLSPCSTLAVRLAKQNTYIGSHAGRRDLVCHDSIVLRVGVATEVGSSRGVGGDRGRFGSRCDRRRDRRDRRRAGAGEVDAHGVAAAADFVRVADASEVAGGDAVDVVVGIIVATPALEKPKKKKKTAN